MPLHAFCSFDKIGIGLFPLQTVTLAKLLLRSRAQHTGALSRSPPHAVRCQPRRPPAGTRGPSPEALRRRSSCQQGRPPVGGPGGTVPLTCPAQLHMLCWRPLRSPHRLTLSASSALAWSRLSRSTASATPSAPCPPPATASLATPAAHASSCLHRWAVEAVATVAGAPWDQGFLPAAAKGAAAACMLARGRLPGWLPGWLPCPL